MDFHDSPDDAAFRAEVRAWLEANASPKTDESAQEPIFTVDPDAGLDVAREQAWQKKLYDAGWGVITWPKAYGGRDATPIQAFIFREELGRFDVPPHSAYLVGHGMVGPTIIAHGTDAQKERFIPPMAEGTEIWCQLWSEPGAGSDLASLATRAERDSSGGDWILNGQKVWTTGAHFSKWGLIIARTDPDLPKHRGITCFIVDMKGPGVEVRPLRQMTGGSDFNEVFFSDVRVPDDQRVGEINDGWRVAMTTLMNERYAVGLGGFGEGMVTPLVRLARKRIGEPDGSNTDSWQTIAEIYVKAKLLSLCGYRSLTAMARGGIPGPEGSIAKLLRTNLVSQIAKAGTEILGFEGLLLSGDALDDGVWAADYLGGPGSKIGGGTDEIMKNILGERVLGLPKEPDPMKEFSFKESRR